MTGSAQSPGERIIEASGQLDAVHRELEVHSRDDGVAVATRLTQVFPATSEALWECCVDEERLAQWFAPVTGELRLGGRFRVQDDASGTIERCVPPSGDGMGEMQLSWEFGEDVSQVLVRCEPVPGAAGSARVMLEHRGVLPPDFWLTYGPGAGGVGWDLVLLGLAHHLRTGSTVPPEQSLWVTTPAAAEFVGGSSEAWGRASTEAGTPTELAEAAARRTAVFYTTPDAED